MLPCVFWDVTATDAMLTPALDTLWQPTVSTQPAPLWLILKKKKKRRQGGSGEWHCAHDHTQDNVCQQQQQCHYVRETKTDNRGWFHGALTLHVQSSKDYHTSRRDPSSIGFNLFVFYPEAELWPLHTTEAKFILFKWKFNFFPPFQLYLYIWHPVRQAESTACWLMELLALSSSRGWSEGVSVSR